MTKVEKPDYSVVLKKETIKEGDVDFSVSVVSPFTITEIVVPINVKDSVFGRIIFLKRADYER